MTPLQAPPAATRMMQRAGIDPAIIGDLMEEYSRDRSRLWYWTQAFGALTTKSSPLSQLIAAARWAAALPLAILIVRVVSRLAGVLFWSLIPRDFAHGRFLLYSESFLIAAAFLGAMVLVAPARKDSVARIALGVVLICSAVPLALSTSSGDRWTGLLIGMCGVLGGLAAYGLLTTAAARRKSRPAVASIYELRKKV